MHSFKINAPVNPQDCSVEMDGVKLDGVVSVSFSLAANKVTTLRLEIIGLVQVDGEFEDKHIVKVERANER